MGQLRVTNGVVTEQGAGMLSPQSLGLILKHWILQGTRTDEKSISVLSPCASPGQLVVTVCLSVPKKDIRRATMKCQPGSAVLGIQSINLALHSEKQISISVPFSLVNCFSVSFPVFLLYAWMMEHTINSKMPWVGVVVIINTFCGHPWSWRMNRLTKHGLLASFECSLSPLLLHCATITGSLPAAADLDPPALQPGRFKVATRCYTSLHAVVLLSLLWENPQNSVPITGTLIIPAGEEAPPYLSPQFEFLKNIPVTHQLFRLSHKQQPQQKDQGLQGQRKWAKLSPSTSNPSRPWWRFGACRCCGKV